MPDTRTVLELAQQLRAQVDSRDAAALGRLARAYAKIANRLQDKIDLLIREIGDLENPTAGQVARMARYRSLLRDANAELSAYQGFARVEINDLADRAIASGALDARKMAAIQYGDVSLEAGFNYLPNEAIKAMLGFIQPDSPLYQRLDQLGPTTAARVGDALLEGIGLGYNPTKVARQINNALGMGLTDAMRMARTAHLYAYREANRATYIANADVVEGWIWYAELDGACPSCIAMHGTFHTSDERLNDHHNGRCTQIPKVIGRDNPVDQTGVDWFKNLPEEQQRKILGPAKFEAWSSGQVTIPDLVAVHEDDVYGAMRHEASLKSLGVPASLDNAA